MNLSKNLKRFCSLMLAIIMVFGMLPLSADAAESGRESSTIFFATDRHAESSKLNSLLKALAYTPGLVVLGGDHVNNTDSGSLASITAEIQEVYPGVQTFYTYAAHDTNVSADSSNPYAYARTGEYYEGADYYVYALDQDAMQSASTAATASANFKTWAATADSSKVIFVMCHMPIHSRRGDNAGGATWMSALNEVGQSHDIVYLWGHNHTGENSTDTNVYFVGVGGSLTPQGGSTGTINFTYMNAGYIKNGYASMVVVNGDTVNVTRYNTSGSATANYSIERRFAETHTWEVTESVAATCDTAGYETLVCADCGETKTNVIAATGHNYSSVVQNTCTGSCTIYTCAVCGHSYTEQNATETTYDSVSTLTEGESYVIVASNYALTYGSSAGHTSVSVSNGSITSDVNDAMIWTYQNGMLYNEANGKYINLSSSSSGWGGSSRKAITFSTSGVSVSYSSNQLKLDSSYLYYSSSSGFSARSSGSTVSLYQVNEAVGGTGEHVYTTTTIEPTCTENGSVTYTCTACGHSYSEVIEATGTHSYESVTVDATCTENGSVTYTCACGDTYSEVIDATGHDYESVTVEATCSKDGSTTHTCTVCGDTYSEIIEATGTHSYESVTVNATCTENGSVTYTCACGDSYTETIPATGHDYEAVVTAPTCTEAGFTTYTCACGDSYVDDETDALGHTYESVTKEPTCTENGYTGNTCVNCGDTTVTDETPALGHSYETVTVDATCDTDGSVTETCVNCGHSNVEVIPATGHDYTSYTVTLTCTEDGFTKYTCSTCGHIYYENYVEAAGHNYEVTVENGYNVYTCTVCGDSYSDEVVVTYNRVNTITSGNTYVVTVYSSGKYYALTHANNTLSVVQVTKENSWISSEVTEDMLWTYQNSKLSYETEDGKTYYLYCPGSNRALTVSTSRSSNVSFSSSKLKVGSYYLRYNLGRVIGYRTGTTTYMFIES